jgi:2'-5' RNA ligase
MVKALTEPRRVYEQLWCKSRALLKSGRIQIDPRLRDKAGDLRRGITLVAWPDAAVKKTVKNFVREVADICPRQHFYKSPELHMTVMAIISGSESWRDKIDRLPACRRALEQVLNQSRPFRVHFRGVTVSPNAVLIQGFPLDDALLQLRDEIRDAFGKAGLGGLLDRRYKTGTAHLTVMRFSEPETDWKRLVDFLEKNRETDFGGTLFKSLQLIWSNWYASAGVVRVLQEYPLKD